MKSLNNEEQTCGPLITAPVIVWRCGAMQHSSGCLLCYLTSRLEQFRSNLPLGALTYSMLSGEDFFFFFFLLETMTRSFPSDSWCSLIHRKEKKPGNNLTFLSLEMIKDCRFSSGVTKRSHFLFVLFYSVRPQTPAPAN